MERGSDEVALLNGDSFASVLPNGLNLATPTTYDWGPNEHAEHRLGENGEGNAVFEGVDLGTERVALDFDIEQVERELVGATNDGPRHHDHAHTGAPDGHPVGGGGSKSRSESKTLHEEADGRAFAARNDDPFDMGQFFGQSDLSKIKAFAAGLSKGIEVLLEIALDRNDTNSHMRKFGTTGSCGL